MRDFQKKWGFKLFMQSKIFLVFMGIIILFFSYNMFGLMSKMKETRRNKQVAEEKLALLEKSKEKLSSDIVKLNTEKGVEESIREKFGLAKEGEEMVLIVEEKKSENTEGTQKSDSFFSFFKNWFD